MAKALEIRTLESKLGVARGGSWVGRVAGWRGGRAAGRQGGRAAGRQGGRGWGRQTSLIDFAYDTDWTGLRN
jgi:hypothetical protein